METLIKVENLYFKYLDKYILNNINIEINSGDFISVIGKNASGKSTLAMLLNGILIPSSGDVIVSSINTKNLKERLKIRMDIGVVFQNPENQIVGTTVFEDTAFGPENIGMENKEVKKIVNETLKYVGLYEKRYCQPYMLSGGEKQKLAIAGVLAMNPKCIILDEAFSMIDNYNRTKIMKLIFDLNKEKNIAIIQISHNPDEIFKSKNIIIIDEGSLLFNGDTNDIFEFYSKIKEIGLDFPEITELLIGINKKGYNINTNLLKVDNGIEEIKRLLWS